MSAPLPDCPGCGCVADGLCLCPRPSIAPRNWRTVAEGLRLEAAAHYRARAVAARQYVAARAPIGPPPPRFIDRLLDWLL